MKKLLIAAGLLMVVLSSCLKNEDYVDQGAIDQQKIRDYVAAKGLDTEVDSYTGIHFIIEEYGDTTRRPNRDSALVTVNYEGRLLNDEIFDAGDSTEFDLRSTIAGWQYTIPALGIGGKMFMILPSQLGYGSQARTDSLGEVVIPANSVLVFDVELLDIEKNE